MFFSFGDHPAPQKGSCPGHERFPGDGRAAGMLFLAGELHRQTHVG